MTTIEQLRRKADQHWELAGLARLDRDFADEARHIGLARKLERRIREMKVFGKLKSEAASVALTAEQAELPPETAETERMERIGDCTLYLSDCLEILPMLQAGSIDLILADLPYGTTQNKWDSVIPLQPLWSEYWRVLKPNGAIVLTAQTPFDKVLGSSCLKYLKYEWIWEKTHPTGHLNAKKAPMKAHENVLVFYRSLPTYNPQKTTGHVRKTAVKRKDDTPTYGKQKFDALPYDSTERYPRSVITFASDKQKSTLHPCQKPVSLMRYLIRTYSNEGQIVLDNCMGSGTTGVACVEEGRKFIGIEIDPDYFNIACDRIRKTYAQPDVLIEATKAEPRSTQGGNDVG